MTDREYALHLKQSRTAWYIRLYLWLYVADPNRIDTCKLFWAFVFAPIVLPIALVSSAAHKLRIRRRKVKVYDSGKISSRERRLEKVSAHLSRAYTALLVTASAVVIALLLFVLLYALITKPLSILLGLLVGGAGSVIALGLLKMLSSSGFWRLMRALGRGVHRRTCAKIDLH